jgi:hypothetical protein
MQKLPDKKIANVLQMNARVADIEIIQKKSDSH